MKNNWKDIKKYYIHHNVTLEDCAKKYNVSLRTVQTHCSKENWTELREQKREEIAQKSEERIIDRKIAANEKHFELYEKVAKAADLILSTNKKISACVLYQLVEIVRKVQLGQRLCLNMGTDDVVDSTPEIMIINGLDEDKI